MKRTGNLSCSITLSLLLTCGSALAGVTTPNPSAPPEVKITGVATPNPEPPAPSGLAFETSQTAYQPFMNFELIDLIVIGLSNMGSNLL
ncbi:MAG TPA: hypothetical protein VKC34_17250 [Blastocatellia bacterium]|nr:hypothetical protein [Blastocatellia bacterium]